MVLPLAESESDDELLVEVRLVGVVLPRSESELDDKELDVVFFSVLRPSSLSEFEDDSSDGAVSYSLVDMVFLFRNFVKVRTRRKLETKCTCCLSLS